MQFGASAFTQERASPERGSYYGGWPAWPWPSWVSATPAFLYYDGAAYPTSMDLCVESHLPVCMQKNGRAFSHCTDVVFSRCKQESLQVASVYEPYPGG